MSTLVPLKKQHQSTFLRSQSHAVGAVLKRLTPTVSPPPRSLSTSMFKSSPFSPPRLHPRDALNEHCRGLPLRLSLQRLVSYFFQSA